MVPRRARAAPYAVTRGSRCRPSSLAFPRTFVVAPRAPVFVLPRLSLTLRRSLGERRLVAAYWARQPPAIGLLGVVFPLPRRYVLRANVF